MPSACCIGDCGLLHSRLASNRAKREKSHPRCPPRVPCLPPALLRLFRPPSQPPHPRRHRVHLRAVLGLLWCPAWPKDCHGWRLSACMCFGDASSTSAPPLGFRTLIPPPPPPHRLAPPLACPASFSLLCFVFSPSPRHLASPCAPRTLILGTASWSPRCCPSPSLPLDTWPSRCAFGSHARCRRCFSRRNSRRSRHCFASPGSGYVARVPLRTCRTAAAPPWHTAG